MAEKTIPWWRKALKFALGGIRSGFGIFSRPQRSESETEAPPEIQTDIGISGNNEEAPRQAESLEEEKALTEDSPKLTPASEASAIEAQAAAAVSTADAAVAANIAVVVAKKTEPVAVPESELEAEPEIAATAAPVIEATELAEHAPELEAEAALVIAAIAEPEIEQEIETEPTTETEVEAESESEIEAEQVIETEPETIEEPVAEKKIENKPDAEFDDAEPEVIAEPIAEPEIEIENVAVANPQIEVAEVEKVADDEPEEIFEVIVEPVEVAPMDEKQIAAEPEAEAAVIESDPVSEPIATSVAEPDQIEETESEPNAEPDQSEEPESEPIEALEAAAEVNETAEITEPAELSEVAAVADEVVEVEPVNPVEEEPVAEAVAVIEAEAAQALDDEPEQIQSAEPKVVSNAEPELNSASSPDAISDLSPDLNSALDSVSIPEQNSVQNLTPAPVEAPVTVAAPPTPEKHPIKIESRDDQNDLSPFSVIVDQVYDGPLDLLLDLIRKQDIDIYDIPIAKITAQFLAYVNQLKSGDVDVAGEFIYTASLLIHIKSKMLLPRSPAGPGETVEDPRRELVERLLEHERFKNAAQMLQQKQMLEAASWSNPGAREFKDDAATEPEIAADTVDLVRIFRDILERARKRPVFNLNEDSVTVGQMIQFLARRLTMEDKPVALRRLLSNTNSERALIAMFLALLELVRLQAILLRQDLAFSEIFIKKHTGFDAVMNEGLINARDDWK